MDPVGLTSRWMAAARARESQRLDRLFDDPLAAALAGPEGFAWLDELERAQPWGEPALYVVVRTRFFDEFLLRATWEAGARQVVLLAAGMDARAFRLGWPPGTRLYELDRPEVIDAKDAVASRAGAHLTCERQTISVDLEHPSWSDALLSAEYEAQEWSVWLAEGLLFYMTEAASTLGADLVNRDLLSSPVMWPLLEVLSRRGAPGRFGTNDPEPLFAEHGWEAEVTQPGEREANYGRWPYPVAPRRMPGVPRLFLIRAQRW